MSQQAVLSAHQLSEHWQVLSPRPQRGWLEGGQAAGVCGHSQGPPVHGGQPRHLPVALGVCSEGKILKPALGGLVSCSSLLPRLRDTGRETGDSLH